MYTIRKTFKFEMAHQLQDAYSKACSDQIHGHSYILEVYFKNRELNKDGMVIDFKQVKDVLGEYINSWDHCLVMPNTMDKDYLDVLAKYNKNLKIVDYNPTAENMCRDIFQKIYKTFPNIVKVRLHETTTGWAEYEM